MIKDGLVLSTGNATAALLSLARNIIIARLISVEDFGIASTFAVAMALLEMASNISLERLLVQAKDGESQELLSTMHAIQAARGLFGAALLFLIAKPLASVFGVPEVAWAYQALAVNPLLRGLAHLDMYRRQRSMQFLPTISVEVAAQLTSTMTALPVALWIGDYRVMLIALLVQQIVFTLASHTVAARPYRWSWNRDIARRAIAFGWPLLLNGILMFGIFHGDRIIVGSLIGMVELGWFSAAFMLTLAPTMVIAKTLDVFFLPQLSAARERVSDFQGLCTATIQAALLMGILLAIVFALVGSPMLTLLYGAKYGPAVPMLVALAAMQALRLAKGGPIIIALSIAESKNPLVANLARVLVLPMAWLGVAYGGGVMTVVILGIVGEGAALAVSLFLLRDRLIWRSPDVALPLGVGLSVLALVLVIVYIEGFGSFASIDAGLAHLLLIGTVPLLLWPMRSLRRWGKAMWRAG